MENTLTQRLTRTIGVLLTAFCLLSIASGARAQTTAIYPITNTAIVAVGQVAATTNGAGHNYQSVSTGSGWVVSFVGRDLKLPAYYSGTTSSGFLYVSVDGGAFTAQTSPATGWQTGYDLTPGLGATDSTHTVMVIGTDNFLMDTDTSFSVTAAGSPALTAPAGFCSQQVLFGGANIDHGAMNLANGGVTNVYQGQQDSDLLFSDTGNCQGIRVFEYNSGEIVRVMRDGTDQTVQTLSAVGVNSWGLHSVSIPTPDTSPHIWDIHLTSGTCAIYAIMVYGPNGTSVISTAALIPRKVLVGFGDSIVRGNLGTGNDSSLSWLWRLAQTLGYATYNLGVSNTTVRNFGTGSVVFTTQSGEARASTSLSAISPPPAIIICPYGTNDMAQTGGAETIANFSASDQNMMTLMLSHTPTTTKIARFGILPRGDSYNSQRSAWNSTIQSDVAAVGNSRLAYYSSDFTGFNPAAGFGTADGIHPNSTGSPFIAAGMYANYFCRFFRKLSFGSGRFGSRSSQ